jgi:hypothetical protein
VAVECEKDSFSRPRGLAEKLEIRELRDGFGIFFGVQRKIKSTKIDAERGTNLKLEARNVLGVNPIDHELHSLVHMAVRGPFLIKSCMDRKD